MANAKEKNGFLLTNKQTGPTSHDIIARLRKITGIKKIGHAGTLDPFASGLLLVGIGEATKLLGHYVGLDKTYEATLKLGATSDTQDRTGTISNVRKVSIAKKDIESVLHSFIGKQKQTPPMHSAKKIGGIRLYKLARQGKEVERKPVEIEVHGIKLLSLKGDLLKIRCRVSSGAFIRTLAADIGKKLKTGAYVEELKRTAIGNFKIKDAIALRHAELDSASASSKNKKQTLNQVQGDVLSHLIPFKTVLVSGTFDGLHEGHKNYFQQARQLGARIICIVGRDSVVEKIKGRKPKLPEKERIKLVKQCPEIDRVYLGISGPDSEVYDFVASLKPDVIALGYDQKAYTKGLRAEMKKRGLLIEVIKLKPYLPEQYKSSIIDKSIKKR
ncbi:MAG: tRNA pseudouridine(55) synthase TruB [Parcubacteria group bacterium]|nr:tRNA pseudouridine(55) synthase TruB [Parcubacteria group bacterium]